MDKMILGRYIPGNSLIHRLDPRSKLLSMFLFVLIIFWANNLATNLLLFVFTFFLVFLSRVPIGFFVKGLQSMLFSSYLLQREILLSNFPLFALQI